MIAIDNKEVKFFKFPDGQWHFDLIEHIVKPPFNHYSISASLTSFEEVVKLLLVCNVLNRCGEILIVGITYLIGSRMDRAITISQPFTLGTIMALLNSIKCDELRILEPHSDIPALLSNKDITCVYWYEYLKDIESLPKNCTLVAPDAGMYKKFKILRDDFGGKELARAEKIRDIKTGEIKCHVIIEGEISGRDCLVVDDICDGGATFISLAKILKQCGANRLYLAVCHGIFSKGLHSLLEYYEHIWYSNSYYPHGLGFAEESSLERTTMINVYEGIDFNE